MNTFLPLPDFKQSAVVLDYMRLGKQRVEVFQLLRCISGETTGWRNHPCTKMWKSYKNALAYYGLAMCDEWIRRGFKDNLQSQIAGYIVGDEIKMPHWLGRESFHASHRANLLRKDPVWYRQFGWTDSPILFYEWPTDPAVEGATKCVS